MSPRHPAHHQGHTHNWHGGRAGSPSIQTPLVCYWRQELVRGTGQRVPSAERGILGDTAHRRSRDDLYKGENGLGDLT